MNLAAQRQEKGQAIVMVVILLAILGGGWWYLKSARDQKEREAWAFAQEAAERIIFRGDMRFMDLTLSPEAKVHYMPSWRERLLQRIREQGAPQSEIHVTGNVEFTHQFLDPQGHFHATVEYVDGPAYLQFTVSHPGVLWQIDTLNWIWQRSRYQPSDSNEPPPSPSASNPGQRKAP